VPLQTYRVFHLTLDGGPLGPQNQGAMREIFETRIPQAGRELTGGPDLEVYPADFNPAKQGATLELWIPVKSRYPTRRWVYSFANCLPCLLSEDVYLLS
jgi:predicted transcriptional regulator YdeE